MARPRKNKQQDDTEIAEEGLEEKSEAKVRAREISRFCEKCGGILFGGQILHKKGCKNNESY